MSLRRTVAGIARDDHTAVHGEPALRSQGPNSPAEANARVSQAAEASITLFLERGVRAAFGTVDRPVGLA